MTDSKRKTYDEAQKAWKAYMEARLARNEVLGPFNEAIVRAWKAYLEAEKACDEAGGE